MDNLDNRMDENAAAQPTDAQGADNGPQEGRDTGATSAREAQENDEQRGRNAEKRIRREQRIAEQARREERERLDALLKGAEIEKSDGSTISGVSDLENVVTARRKKRFATGKATEEDVAEVVRAAIKGAQPQPDEAQRQLDMIRDMDPSMTDLGAILSSDIGEGFRKYVQEGSSFTQAYGRAVREKNARTDGARAAETAKAAGKGHMVVSSQRGAGALEVPPRIKQLYRDTDPSMTDAEIQAHYNKYIRQTG